MKKFVLFGLIAVLSFGFAGCKSEPVYDPKPPQPDHEPVYLPVSIQAVEYDATSDKTKVVLGVSGHYNHDVSVDGDQRSYFKAGALGLRLELVAVYVDEDGETGKVYTLADWQGKKYPILISDISPK